MEELGEWGEQKGHKIVVLDDLMMDAADSLEIAHMMCVGSHHYNMSQGLYLKNISIGTKQNEIVTVQGCRSHRFSFLKHILKRPHKNIHIS
jgi:hypothetical protein